MSSSAQQGQDAGAPAKQVEEKTPECKDDDDAVMEEAAPAVPEMPFMSASRIQELMRADGPVVKAVVLRASGAVDEIEYDTTPRRNMATEILGCAPTFIGEWTELQVMVARGRFDELDEEEAARVPVNQHKLRFPFTDARVLGDILCYRVDADARNVDFTKAQYEAFAAEAHLDEGKVWEPMDIDEEDEEEGEEEDGGFFDPANLRAHIEGIVRRQHKEKHGTDITDEELAEYADQIDMMFQGVLGGQAADDGEEEYVPDLEEEEESDDDIAEDGEEEEEEEDEEDWRTMMPDALAQVRAAARSGRHEMLNKVAAEFEAESGEKVKVSQLVTAMEVLRVQLGLQADDDEDEAKVEQAIEQAKTTFAPLVPLAEGDEPGPQDAADGDEEEDAGMPLTEAELRQEVHEALDHVRALGAAHGRVLAERFSQTFYEVNGRLPDEAELAAMFDRVRGEFAAEARDALLEDGVDVGEEKEEDEDVEDDADPMDVCGDEEEEEEDADYDATFTASLTAEEKARLAALAREQIPPALQAGLRAKFVELVGREPTEAEFDDLLVATATTSMLDGGFDAEEEEEEAGAAAEALDEEYVPTAEEKAEAEQEAAAAADVTAEEAAELDAEVRDLRALADDDDEAAAAGKTWASQLTAELVAEAKGQFASLHGRDPSAAELEEVAKMMLSTRLAEAALDFASDDDEDSDYVPDLEEEEEERGSSADEEDEEEEDTAKADENADTTNAAAAAGPAAGAKQRTAEMADADE